MAYADGELRGIKGWLLFFVISLGVFSPAALIISAYRDLYSDPQLAAILGDKWSTVVAYDCGSAAIGCAGAWFCVWRLIEVRTPATPRIVIVGLWLIGPVLMIATLLLGSVLFNASIGTMMAGVGAGLVRPFVYAGIWTAYLLNSKRVANTYGAPTEDLAATFE